MRSADPRAIRATRGAAQTPLPRAGWAPVVTGAYLLFWLALALGGGSSRIDNPWLLAERPVTVTCLFVFLLAATPADWRLVRAPLLMLGTMAAIMLAQLVPLPPGLWHALPGRDRFAEGLTLAGAGGRWLPASVAPDRTWNSLAALVAPAGALIGYAVLSPRMRALTLPALIVLGLASALLGIVQITGGDASPFYYYPKSNAGMPIGLLANRNHAGAFFALLIPMLRAWSLSPAGMAMPLHRRGPLAGTLGIFLVPLVFVTGSRSGLALLGVGLVGAYLVRPVGIDPRRITRHSWIAIGASAGAGALALWAVLASGRAVAVYRLAQGDAITSDARFGFTPVVVEALRAGFPVGWGFGAFDPVFRSFEPDRLLNITYVNNAHDDLLELLLTGGLAAGLVLAAFLWWLTRRSAAVFAAGTRSHVVRARAAAVMIAMLLLASLTDYPLRTPLLGAVFALLCAWLVDLPSARQAVASERGGL